MNKKLVLDEQAIDAFMCVSWIFTINVFSSFGHYFSEWLAWYFIMTVTLSYFILKIAFNTKNHILKIRIKDIPWCSICYAIFVLYVYFSQYWATSPNTKTDVLFSLLVDFTLILCMELYFGFCNKATKLPFVFVISVLIFGIVVTATTPISNWGSARGYGGITTVNRNMASYMFVVAFGICIYLVQIYGNYMYVISALFILFSLITGSRKGIIQIVLTVAIYIVLKENVREKIRMIAILAIIGIIGLICFMNIPFLQETYGNRLLAIFDDSIEDSSRDNRTIMRMNALGAFLKRPIFGNGVAYTNVINKKVLGVSVYSHNNFLELLCNYGIVGFLLYYSMYFYSILKSYTKKMDVYAKMVLTCLIPLMVIEYGQITYYVKIGVIPMMVLFLTARYCVATEQECEKNGING